MQGRRLTRRLVQKQQNYEYRAIIHNSIPLDLETGGYRNSEAIELTNDIGKRTAAINSEPLETQFLSRFNGFSSQSRVAVSARFGTHSQMTIFFDIRESHSIENLTEFQFKSLHASCWWAIK